MRDQFANVPVRVPQERRNAERKARALKEKKAAEERLERDKAARLAAMEKLREAEERVMNAQAAARLSAAQAEKEEAARVGKQAREGARHARCSQLGSGDSGSDSGVAQRRRLALRSCSGFRRHVRRAQHGGRPRPRRTDVRLPPLLHVVGLSVAMLCNA